MRTADDVASGYTSHHPAHAIARTALTVFSHCHNTIPFLFHSYSIPFMFHSILLRSVVFHGS